MNLPVHFHKYFLFREMTWHMLLLFYRRWAVVVLLLKWVFELQHCISYGAARFTCLCKYLNGQKDLIDNIDNCMRESVKFYLIFNHFESSCTLGSAEKVWTSNNNAAKLFCSCMMHMRCKSQFGLCLPQNFCKWKRISPTYGAVVYLPWLEYLALHRKGWINVSIWASAYLPLP